MPQRLSDSAQGTSADCQVNVATCSGVKVTISFSRPSRILFAQAGSPRSARPTAARTQEAMASP